MNAYRPRILLFGFICLLVLWIDSSVRALDVPPLSSRVNDLAGMLPTDKARQLEERLRQFEQDTGHQIVALTIPSLEGEPLEEFSIRVADAWKIGQQGTANGVILIIAQKERSALRLAEALKAYYRMPSPVGSFEKLSFRVIVKATTPAVSKPVSNPS